MRYSLKMSFVKVNRTVPFDNFPFQELLIWSYYRHRLYLHFHRMDVDSKTVRGRYLCVFESLNFIMFISQMTNQL